MRYTVEYNPSFLEEFTKKLIREHLEESYELHKSGEYVSKLYNIEDIITKEKKYQFLPDELSKNLLEYLEMLLTDKVDYIEL
tara:strand:- start:301 stop:546 length:246 start_codon:yes stop_codon:yes gene_type:complete